MKRLLWFGFYDPQFMRTRIVIAELRVRGIVVDECRVDPRVAKKGKFLALWRQSRKFRGTRYDAVIVGFPGFNAVWLAKLLFSAPVVYDAGFSIWQAEVEDRRSCRPRSPRAALLYATDWVNARLAQVVILDTDVHIGFFSKLVRVSPKKFFVLPVGGGEPFRPMAFKTEGKFTVLFHGSFIPLHGIETILDAAALLRDRDDIAFRLVGAGQMAKQMRRRAEELALTGVHFTGTLPQSSPDGASVVQEIRDADVVLGIFGTGRKTTLSVPTKVYEALACGKPIITADTPALREMLTVGRDVLAVPAGDAGALAAAILRLKEEPPLRAALAAQGLAAFRARYAPERVCDRFLSEMTRLLS